MIYKDLYYVSDTVKGVARSSNKDFFYICSRNNDSEYLIMVFDGVSSERNARHGARMACNYLSKEFKNDESNYDFKKIIFNANQKLVFSKYHRPYTTICALFVNLNNSPWAEFYSLGDTRGYVVSATNIKQITFDHRSEYYNNVLTRCLGMEDLSVDDIFCSGKLYETEFLLCTDGFYSLMENNVSLFHGIIRDIKIKNFSIRLRRIIDGNNADDATYVFVRIVNV